MAKKRVPLERAETAAAQIGRKLKKVMPEGWGFFLVLTSFGENGHITYTSSLERPGAIRTLRELADRLEREEPSL